MEGTPRSLEHPFPGRLLRRVVLSSYSSGREALVGMEYQDGIPQGSDALDELERSFCAGCLGVVREQYIYF